MKCSIKMNYLEKNLSDFFKKKFCCFTGNGTTAIYLVLQALGLKNKIVLYPAITCTNPVNAAIYAGYKVMFCDVNLEDYTMDVNSLEYMLQKYDIGVVVPTHIYGYRCNMEKIRELCKKYNVFILEDGAQSTYFDENSNASIISFGHTKIFENSFGGGAVFTNNEKLFNKIKNLKCTLNKKPDNSDKLFDDYREKYYSIIKSSLSLKDKYHKLYKLQIDFKDAFLFDEENNEDILNILKESNEIINLRKNKALLYEKYLDKTYIDTPKVNFNYIVPWRYSFLFKGNRDELLHLIRERNIDVSSWYISLQYIYNFDDCNNLINAKYIEDHIVNLWVSKDHSENKIKSDINIINNIMKKIKELSNE